MATVTALGNSFNTTAGTHTVTATPAVGDLIIIISMNTGYTATVPPTDANTDGLGTYSQINANVLKASSADTMQAWVRNAPIGSASSTVFTQLAASSTGGGLEVYKIVTTGVNYGLGAIRQSAIQQNVASGTPAPVMGAACLTGNPVFLAVFNATSPAGTTVRSSPAYTSDSNVGYATPTAGGIWTHVASGETGTTLTWGGASASAFCSIAIEIDTATPTPIMTNLQQYDNDAVTPIPIGGSSVLANDETRVF